MKAYLFILCWLLTLFIGLAIVTVVTGEIRFGLLFTLIAGLCSLPFILIFWGVMYTLIKKNPTRTELHQWTLAIHAGGSLLTFLVIILFENNFLFPLMAIMFGYFVIDSGLFHFIIHQRHPVGTEKVESDEILDDAL